MPTLTPQQVRDFLARPDVACHISCLDDDGAPYLVPTTYLYEDDGFYLWARARSRWGEYLARDGRVALCIDGGVEEGNEWAKRVVVRGLAEPHRAVVASDSRGHRGISACFPRPESDFLPIRDPAGATILDA